MDELRRENERLRQENKELRDLLKQVSERLLVAEQTIKQLREQLGQNRRHPKPKSLRQTGGQEGHTLNFNPQPDVIEKHRPKD